MEKEVERIFSWYKQQKQDLERKIYWDNSTRLRRAWLTYSDWSRADILREEIDFNVEILARLKEWLPKLDTRSEKRMLLITILSLKNRTEYASHQADVYPIMITLVAFCFAILSIIPSIGLRAMVGGGILMLIFGMVHNRITTRNKIALTKELINILELYKAEHA